VANFNKWLFQRRLIAILVHTFSFYWIVFVCMYYAAYVKTSVRSVSLAIILFVFMLCHWRMIYDSDLKRRPTD
jgi:hypothetical protein